ncbi:hypothetical protein PGT21_028579 [Puccinia graminis f. sp. tritici]|uniref:HAT C-terminal dimerisation domain-containing protein n=1 Tax=Puccinia graminis f. sp. tritici TaxID=56615 RepID=A0A5B0MJ84_PUCGR|nr:hypothetical protein PGTUg99_023376 [Puccinia graminis f. sp. tritici]KAA1091213.1 hypothetical protein PGT21_028579 [Puccinia graminis f. sp. tritici]
MHLFELAFGAESSEVTECLNLLKQEFQLVQDEQKRNTEKTPNPDLIVLDNAPVDQPTSLMARLAMCMKQKPAAQEDEIAAYLKANLNFKKGAIDRKATPLKWWKANQSTYPTLAIIARAYLGTPGSSCSVERLFSAASDVCSSRRGRLLPSTMSHCVSSLMWLREEVGLTGEFQEAG